MREDIEKKENQLAELQKKLNNLESTKGVKLDEMKREMDKIRDEMALKKVDKEEAYVKAQEEKIRDLEKTKDMKGLSLSEADLEDDKTSDILNKKEEEKRPRIKVKLKEKESEAKVEPKEEKKEEEKEPEVKTETKEKEQTVDEYRQKFLQDQLESAKVAWEDDPQNKSLEKDFEKAKKELKKFQDEMAKKPANIKPENNTTIEKNTVEESANILEAAKVLDEARAKYITEYKKCKSEADKQNLINKTKNSILNIFKSKENKKHLHAEDLSTAELEKSSKEYLAAKKEMGNVMFNEKKAELEKAGLTGEELEKALINYKATEVIAKTITEEHQKVINAKAEKPALLRRLLEGYMKIKPRWKKVALSTALFTLAAGTGIVSGGIFAGYGLATMAGMKFGASMAMGALVGHSVKGVDLIKKKSDLKFIEAKYNQKIGLKDKFAREEIGVEEYERGMGEIENAEKKRARIRMFVKLGVGVALAGTAGFFAYDAMGNGITETGLATGNVDAMSGPDISHLQTEGASSVEHAEVIATADNGQGAISTLRELQSNLKAEYPDLENAPDSVKHIINADINKLAQEYGMYKPGEDAESILISKGSSFQVNESGDVIYHDGASNNDFLLEKADAKISGAYEGKMIDTDNTISSAQEAPITSSTNEFINPVSLHPDTVGIENQDINVNTETPKITEPQIIEKTQFEIDNPQVAPEGATVENANVENTNIAEENTNVNALSPEAIERVNQTYDQNINHLFPEEKGALAWENVKGKTPGNLFKVEQEGGLNEIYKPLASYLHKLHDVTGLEPREVSIINPVPETNAEYIERALQKAEEINLLDKVKL
jgi:hypothetical protein